MSESLEGTLILKNDIVHITETFQKRTFVIEIIEGDQGQYSNVLEFELKNDKCALIEKYNVGSEIEVGYNLRGRKWTNGEGVDKYFTSLDAWRVNSTEGNTPSGDVVNEDVAGGDNIPF